jgi:hypothetical protein
MAHEMPRETKPDSGFSPCLTALREANDAAFPPASIVMALALDISADELLGLKPPPWSTAPGADDPETCCLWKRLLAVTPLTEKDQPGGDPLSHSLAAHTEQNGGRDGRTW